MKELLASSVAQQRFQMLLLLGFAVSALVLACLGIYAVLAFAIERRTAEIGIRMALGARPSQVLNATIQNGMLPVAIGIVIGLFGAAGLARIVAHLLFQVSALDPAIYVATAAILLLISALACLIPARRASRLNPLDALRYS